MSAIASFWLIPKSKIRYVIEKARPIIQETRVWVVFRKKHQVDSFPSALADVGEELPDFLWSGYAFNDLELFLEQLGIRLFPEDKQNVGKFLSDERGNSHCVYDAAEARRLKAKLSAIQQVDVEMKRFLENEYDEDYAHEHAGVVVEAFRKMISWLEKVNEDRKSVV